MKKNAYLIVGFLAFLCMSGQSPRKEVREITTMEPEKKELQAEAQQIETEDQRKSAAQRTREHTGQTTEVPKSAAKRVVEAELARFAQD